MSQEVVYMTATLTETVATPDSTIQQTRAKTPVDIAVELIVAETDCTERKARAFVSSMKDNLANVTKAGDTVWYMPVVWLNKYHDILEGIAPDDTRSASGSAHAALEMAVLDGAKGQMGLVHSQRERGNHQYCTVDVVVEVVQA